SGDPGARGGAGPEGATPPRHRRTAGRIPDGVRVARCRGVHARGDRGPAGDPAGHIQGAVVPGPGPAAHGTGGVRRGVGVMSDEKFEEFLQREATAYNAPPPEVPREEMWAVVARARAARSTA